MWDSVFSDCPDFLGVLLAGGEGVGGREVGWVRAVYVAYLRADCSLIDCYALRLMPGQDAVAAVARDARGRGELCQVLVGPAAEVLHLAITGRMLDDGPEDAEARRGAIARAVLAARLDAPGFAEAYAAVAVWGDFIEPWFGCVGVDHSGRLLLDMAEYGERLDIPWTVGV